MGIVHVHRGRLAPALILAVLMALAVIVTLGLAASPASAQSTFTTCASCHNYAGQLDAVPATTTRHRLQHVPPTVSAPPPLPPADVPHPASVVLAPTHSTQLRYDHRCHGVHATAPAITSFSPASASGGHHRDRDRHRLHGTTPGHVQRRLGATFAVVSDDH